MSLKFCLLKLAFTMLENLCSLSLEDNSMFLLALLVNNFSTLVRHPLLACLRIYSLPEEKSHT